MLNHYPRHLKWNRLPGVCPGHTWIFVFLIIIFHSFIGSHSWILFLCLLLIFPGKTFTVIWYYFGWICWKLRYMLFSTEKQINQTLFLYDAVEPISNLWRSLIFLSICSIIWTLTGSSLPKYMNCWLKQQLFTFMQDTISCTIPHDISVNTLDSRS